MAEGFSVAAANGILDKLITDFPWVKLHVGAPGAAGTTNPAVETTRKQPTFSAASGGAKTTSADVVWTGVTGAEDYTHISGWSASSAGSFGWSGLITANAVAINDTFTIPAGDLDLTLPIAS